MNKLKLYIILISSFIYSLATSQVTEDSSSVISNIKDLNDNARALWRSNPDSSKNLAHKALLLSREVHYSEGKGNAYNNLGALNYLNGKFDSAFFYWDLSLKEWEILKDQKQVSKLLGNLALALQEQNKIPEAISYNNRALELRKKIMDSVDIAISYNNIGILYQDMEMSNKAINFHNTAISIREAIGDSARLSSSYTNLGSIFVFENILDSAQFYLNKALLLKTHFNDQWGMTAVYGLLGNLQYARGNYDSSHYYLDKGLTLARDLSSTYHISQFNIYKSKTYLAQNDADKALYFIKQSIPYLTEQNRIDQVAALKLLADIYLKKQNFKKAAEFYSEYTIKNDSLKSINTDQKIADLTASYYYDLKEVQLKAEQEIKEAELNQKISENEVTSSRLLMIIIAIIILLAASISFTLIIKRKNKVLRDQRNEIDALLQEQKEIIEKRTAELLLTKDAISRYAFLNSHELRAPLARILGVIQLADKKIINEKTFIQTIKTCAEELEEAVRKISSELNKH